MSVGPRFDHLLHWVPDVGRAVAGYRAAGLPAHAHAEVDGFQNGGWRLDERYVELLTVTDEQALRSSRYAEGLALLAPAIDAVGGRDGPGGALTFAVDVTDARAASRALRAAGHRTVEFEVALAEHGVSFLEVFLPDLPTWMPFLITYSPPRDELLAALPADAFERGEADLDAVVVTSPDPEGAAARLAALLGLTASGASVPLPGAAVRFEQGPVERIAAVDLVGATGDAEIDGLAYRAS